ncbi:penicillin-binding protein 2 [Rathayibacter rathayi]|uniref:Penicillin-binding protein 2 n=1 Tax=Rathayibacter rathayi TaxID=33887 RepID=A0ABD6W5U8_RATRA|nr:penicillin-binding protein 2 [Rathayibacter rathayi]AZZ50063.1 penicillin-binding protein 2 [Rathayibacter rathayi]MWV75684.1 penicillin-binding protein 2 [Rathayibacter rathayi NCPPB 2980 = VKM Ac-1601]PPF10646.1 penicillin-binding protein 2 [Rathayibacter rathayi]PPF23251.1 penicillin-binding protein 2 [Rathayibacter rathayi]PPF43497.1 penicillin-binding protein 2 [Rathayibacter rathayi]
MNRELKRVSLVVLTMFVALFVSTTTIQVIGADSLEEDRRNTRTINERFRTERGAILVGGQPIASSTPSDDRYKFQRQYANGPLYSAVTGYFTLDQGTTGIERSLNDYLSGTSDSQFFDKVNNLVSGQGPKGASVELSIDAVAQQAAFDALGDHTGAVVVTEPATGRILAMVSKPTFDPTALTSHDTDDVLAAYRALNDDSSEPLVNRAIGGSLNPPGSVFKLVVASAALESGRFTADSSFPNVESFTLPGSSSQVINSGGGLCGSGDTVTLATAVSLSCNVPMAEMGVQLGADAIRSQAEKFGFDAGLEIPMSVEASVYPAKTDDAQTALTAFGQFEVKATPLQIAMVSAAIANGGELMQPNLVDSIRSQDLSVLQKFQEKSLGRVVSTQTADAIKAMMVASVQGGAATNATIGGVTVAGKTGTAENGANDPYTLWFTGFAPANDPQYAITVLVENGGGLGQTGYGNLIAAPIGQQVLEAVLNK